MCFPASGSLHKDDIKQRNEVTHRNATKCYKPYQHRLSLLLTVIIITGANIVSAYYILSPCHEHTHVLLTLLGKTEWLLAPFNRWRHQGSGRVSRLLQVTQWEWQVSQTCLRYSWHLKLPATEAGLGNRTWDLSAIKNVILLDSVALPNSYLLRFPNKLSKLSIASKGILFQSDTTCNYG